VSDSTGSLSICPFIKSLKTYLNDQTFPVEQLEADILSDPEIASNAIETLFNHNVNNFTQSPLVYLLKV
jgi:hypothetical protein